MYYPYLRGRQNELFCLKEMLDNKLLSSYIVPIIEPVRFNKALLDTLNNFIEKGHAIAIVHNPKVGDFMADYQKKLREVDEESDEGKKRKKQNELESLRNVLNDSKITAAFINDSNVKNRILEGKLKTDDIFVINLKDEDYNFYYDKAGEIGAKLTIISRNDEDFLDVVNGAVALLDDGFKKERRNKDYQENDDQLFSKNHLVYQRWGYNGFSDYSIVGEEFEESGFAPAAIAIHIVYFDNREQLRIHHFVSESNEFPTDLARKFGEAMQKLQEWDKYEEIKWTRGISSLIEYYEAGRFPGLGMIKRYSIMHHMELIGRYLEEHT